MLTRPALIRACLAGAAALVLSFAGAGAASAEPRCVHVNDTNIVCV